MITPRKSLFAVALMLLLCALLNTRWTGWLTRPVAASIETLQYPADWLAVRFKTDPPVKERDLSQDQLREELASAHKENARLWAQNKDLREQIEASEVIAIFQDEKTRSVQAEVGNFNDDPQNPTMKLLRGSLHGVKRGDPVVYKHNMLGFVKEVGPVTCTVELITKPGYRSSITIWPPGQIRAEKGWPISNKTVYSDGNGEFYFDMKKQDADAFLQQGDVIRVNDMLRVRATGFVLGEIERFENHPEQEQLMRRVYVRSRTTIGPQRIVTLITERKD